jgi:hypothetical protein
LLPRFIARKNIIALSMSVDYWDYLGWRDTFGQHVFTARQQAYARHLGDGMVYTPQMVIDGRRHMNGADRKAIEAAIRKRMASIDGEARVSLELGMDGDSLNVRVGEGRASAPATLWLALFSHRKRVKVGRGENGGRNLVYHNIVRELTPIGRWRGRPLSISLPGKQLMKRGADGCAVFLQIDNGGPVLAAAEISSWK